jgi:prepilin-type N-terminal cleavage/methylation domain-containing protein
MFAGHTRRSRGFSLIELVIVIVIIGIIAAIAIPRMSRGAAGAGESSLIANLAVLRAQIDLFQTEHGGVFPGANIQTQLTGYTNEAGVVGTKGDGTSIFGPYLREIPKLPVGAKKGESAINAVSTAFAFNSGAFGWWYNTTTGEIKANCDTGEVDARGVQFSAY